MPPGLDPSLGAAHRNTIGSVSREENGTQCQEVDVHQAARRIKGGTLALGLGTALFLVLDMARRVG